MCRAGSSAPKLLGAVGKGEAEVGPQVSLHVKLGVGGLLIKAPTSHPNE